jgi:hypothetical protein
MSFHQTQYINDVEVRPGAEWRQPAQKVIWEVVARCESTEPLTFTSAVVLRGEEMARTGEYPSIDAANSAANKLLRAAMKALFRGLAE